MLQPELQQCAVDAARRLGPYIQTRRDVINRTSVQAGMAHVFLPANVETSMLGGTGLHFAS